MYENVGIRHKSVRFRRKNLIFSHFSKQVFKHGESIPYIRKLSPQEKFALKRCENDGIQHIKTSDLV